MGEAQEIERQYRSLGFPGCLGCLDCASWQWDMCPIGWQGICKGKDFKPTLRMEVVCDDQRAAFNTMQHTAKKMKKLRC
jgi:Plant transposon protein